MPNEKNPCGNPAMHEQPCECALYPYELLKKKPTPKAGLKTLCSTPRRHGKHCDCGMYTVDQTQFLTDAEKARYEEHSLDAMRRGQPRDSIDVGLIAFHRIFKPRR